MENWGNVEIDFLLTLRAKGLPFESIAATMRKYLKINHSAEELEDIWIGLLRGFMQYDGSPNNSMDGHDWTAREIKRLQIMKQHNVSLKRARQILCRSASQIKSQWKLINRPIL